MRQRRDLIQGVPDGLLYAALAGLSAYTKLRLGEEVPQKREGGTHHYAIEKGRRLGTHDSQAGEQRDGQDDGQHDAAGHPEYAVRCPYCGSSVTLKLLIGDLDPPLDQLGDRLPQLGVVPSGARPGRVRRGWRWFWFW